LGTPTLKVLSKGYATTHINTQAGRNEKWSVFKKLGNQHCALIAITGANKNGMSNSFDSLRGIFEEKGRILVNYTLFKNLDSYTVRTPPKPSWRTQGLLSFSQEVFVG